MKYFYKIFFLTLFIVVFVILFAIEPNRLTITNYKLKDPQLSGLKVVLVGDWHIKPHQTTWLNRIIETVNAQKPDLILSVGDYVSGHNEQSTLPINAIAYYLGNLKSTYGVYSVLGNHDGWANADKVAAALKKAGITVLANSNIKLQLKDITLYLAGVEDMTTGTPKLYKALDMTEGPVIFLTHSPDIFPKVPNIVNLTVAGHMHGGQIRLPFVGALITPSQYGKKYLYGLVSENNKKMIVTSGIGTSILPIRINCPPEIVVIEFE